MELIETYNIEFKNNFKKFRMFVRHCSLNAATLLKKRLQHRFFPVNIAKFLRIPTLKNICERLLLVKQH